MEANLNKIIISRINRTIDNLKKNNINAVYVPTKTEALALLESLLVKGETIGVGGSVTLNEIKAIDLISNGNYRFYNRYDKSLSKEQLSELQHKALAADTFICSSNAITETGYLYNVDGTGTRSAAFVYGPKRMIVIAGFNKIVPNLEAAVLRVKEVACPANCVRLDCDTYCSKHGHCVADRCSKENLMTIPAGSAENCICTSTVISGYQRNKERFTVIIVGEELGY